MLYVIFFTSFKKYNHFISINMKRDHYFSDTSPPPPIKELEPCTQPLIKQLILRIDVPNGQ